MSSTRPAMALADPGSSVKHEKQCEICLRCFARTEHLARHRRTHTKEKPFSCPYCPRAFQRSDVKAAHVKNCHAAISGLTSGDVATDSSSSKRARIACDNCRKLKTRCDGQEPCARCQSSSRTCRYSTAPPPSSSSAPSHRLSDDGASVVNSQFRDSESFSSAQRTPSIPMDVKSMGLQFDSSPASHIDHFSTPLSHVGVPMMGHSHATPLNHGSVMTDIGMPLQHLDPAMMDDFWAMPTMNTQFWFQGPELGFVNPFIDTTMTQLPDQTLSLPMQTLTAAMQDYFDSKTRDPSKESKKWYSAQPDMRNHSHDVIRIFLGLFRKHVPKTFTIFDDPFCNPGKDRIHYTLAVAAIGGLFCSVPGSAEVAKTLFNDARRLLFAYFNLRITQAESTAEDYLVTVKTYILLAIYGLCSGDKRSYEFVEAFHQDLCHSVKEYSEACKRMPWQESIQAQSARLLEALHILDCYRVIIMTRPPSLSWHHISQLALDTPHFPQVLQLHHQISKLTGASRLTSPDNNPTLSLSTLAGLSTTIWPAMYPTQNRYNIDSVIFEGSPLGKPDFASISCDNWLRSQTHPIDPNVLTIYHMMNVMLHANITVLQYFAHAGPQSPARDPDRSALAREVFEWNRDGNGKIARWYAKTLISTVEGAFAPPPDTKMDGMGSSTRRPSKVVLPVEAPHVPYAIYYATLVLWCSAACSSLAGGGGGGAATTPVHAQAHIVRGERVLSLHRVHIAQILGRVLNEIK